MERRIEQDEQESKVFSLLCVELRSLAFSNMNFFSGSARHAHDKFYEAFHQLYAHTDPTVGIEASVRKFLSNAYKYDFDYDLPAHGYRSIVKVINKCACKILQLSRYISTNRNSLLFRRGHYGRELLAYVTAFGQFRAMAYYLDKLMYFCGEGELFPDEESMEEDVYREAERLLIEVETLSQECFYGRCLGFQFCASMGRPVATIATVMAAFSDGYLSDSSSTVLKMANSFVGGGKYFMDPELRGEKVVDVTRNCDINFCKAFWSLNENDIMHTLPLFICPPVVLDKLIVLSPDTLHLTSADGQRSLQIGPPVAHSGPGPVNCRLISYSLRQGQEPWKVKGSNNPPMKAPSPALLVHFHGGGFVAQSSASHEVYLRHWAKEMDVPIFSVDYSLAPDNPFPRQLEECFYAYCWATQNCQVLGSTGERICVIGDSAGGNLAMAMSMRAASCDVRVPDGIVSIYGTMLVRYSPSPSRMLSLLDPLLPIGILSRCLAAYTGMTSPSGVNAPMGISMTKNALFVHNEKTQLKSSKLPDYQLSEDCTARIPSIRFSNDAGTIDLTSSYLETDKFVANKNQSIKSILKCPTGDVTCGEDLKPDDNNLVSGIERIDLPSYNDVTQFCLTEEKHVGSDNHVEMYAGSKADSGSEVRKNSYKTGCIKNKPNLTLNLPSAHSKSLSLMRPTSANMKQFDQQFLSVPNMYNGNPPDSATTPSYAQVRHFPQSPVQQFRHLPVSGNPFMSPYLADIELLAGLPPVYFICCHLDPMLDDSIMFAKRLRDMDKEVFIDVLEDLPHGFLNFALISREAYQGSRLCIKRASEVLFPRDTRV